MSIRIKIFGIIALVFLAATGLTWLATVGTIQAEYIKLEADNVKKDTARSVDALGSSVNQLALKIPDWSSWDDTYQYIVDHNKEYIASNVQNAALQNLTINFMLFYNDKQELVSSVGVDIDSGKSIPIPPELIKALMPGSNLLAIDPDDKHQGLLRTSTDPLIVVTRPILRTDGTGPLRGTLVFSQYLSHARIVNLGKLTHLNVSYDPAWDSNGALSLEAAGTSVTAARTQANDSQTIEGFQLINDIYDRPIVVAHVEEPRSIYQETQRTLFFYLFVVLGVTLASILVVLYTTNQIVQKDRMIKLKNEFFSIASHELRTPLTAIMSASSVMKMFYSPKNDAKFDEYISNIYAESVRLIRIVTNFLDAARLEGGKMPIKIESIEIYKPVEVAIGQLQIMGKQKGLYIRTELTRELPLVQTDSEKIQQIIYNLVGNALKFTEQGGITVTGSVVLNHVVITVSDTGRGIDRAGQQKMFKSFQQTRNEDQSMGSGLGLYISKLLVELIGGHIWLASSEEGKGTAISFSLPIAKDQVPVTPALTPNPNPTPTA